jgi:hypothetical protein
MIGHMRPPCIGINFIQNFIQNLDKEKRFEYIQGEGRDKAGLGIKG